MTTTTVPVAERVLLRLPEAAALLSISESQLRTLIRRGVVPVVRLSAVMRVPRQALDELARATDCAAAERCPQCGAPVAMHPGPAPASLFEAKRSATR